GQNVFILDRSLLADEALIHLEKPAYTIMHLHNSHAGDAQRPMDSIMNNNYEFALVNGAKYSAFVSATKSRQPMFKDASLTSKVLPCSCWRGIG
ncbi:glycosyl transferase group 1, partial [Lacticaseibacillus rhamnosus MTCC 5462]